MNRIDRIIKHPLFQECLEQLERAEKERIFCKHNMAHFLDVARICRIINAEEGYGVDNALCYAAALLHDIGKYEQYEKGTPHEKASARIAPGILTDCGFDEKETEQITEAISSHRDEYVAEEKSFRGLLYRADKLSRACYACPAKQECHWDDSRKNCRPVY